MGSKNKKNKAAKKLPDANTAAEVAGNRVFGAGNKVITDERFALSQKDPRFQDVPKHKNKVAIDSRFSRMFTDKNFSTSSARVDKRGKAKNDCVSSQSVLKHYYRIDDAEEKHKKLRKESDSDSGDDDDDDVESDEEKAEYESDDAKKLKNFKGKLSKPSSESESESESTGDEEGGEDVMDDYTSTDTDEDDEAYLEEETNALQQEENVPEIDKETHRLAVVNLDWNQVQAVDLFVVLSSFLPKTGQILSVSVYPSEFGLKRMEEEAVRGPVGLFDDEDWEKKKDDDSDTSDDDEIDNEIDNEKLRAYELSRLRYYFAVVVCDSIATADYIYKSCDGIEFERSSNKLDLRFIPDSMEFKHPPRDVATEAPANYEGIDFQTRALQLSKIDLTWDENEPQRSKKLKRIINIDEESKYTKDDELKEFIASSESESDEDENIADGGDKKRQKTDAYRALLQSGDGSDEDEDDDDEKMDMEVTFNTGLEDLSKKILEKKDKKSETVWDAYLRKRKEKKKARKNRSKNSSDDDESADSDNEHVEEPGDFFAGETTQKKKVSRDKKAQKSEGEDGEATRAELELLLATDEGGDANNVKGYNLKHKKSKGKKDNIDEEKIPTVDYEDPRFSSLFTRPEFALDPTDPRFKRSAAYVRQVAHKQSKGDVDETEGQHNDLLIAAAPAPKADGKGDSKKDKQEISMLLKSIKMKSKQLELPSHGKKSKRKGK